MIRSLLFLLAGIAVGVLIAPEKGADTRKKITACFDDYREGFGELTSSLQLSKADVEDSIEENLLR